VRYKNVKYNYKITYFNINLLKQCSYVTYIHSINYWKTKRDCLNWKSGFKVNFSVEVRTLLWYTFCTFVPCILIISKFYLFTNWCTSESSLKNKTKLKFYSRRVRQTPTNTDLIYAATPTLCYPHTDVF